MPAVAWSSERSWIGGVVGRRNAGFEVLRHAGDELDEAEGTGVHHVRAPQRLELRRRCFERSACGDQRLPEHRADPGHAARCAGRGRAREVGDDREDRAFAGISERLARIGGAAGQRVGELHGGERGPGRRAIADAEQELREDRARVAACAVERGVRDSGQELARVRLGPGAQRGQHGLQGEREIRARVAVRHGKHVDLVDHFLAGDQAVDAGAQRPGELDAAERLAGLGGVVHGRRG